jgi:dolichol-phosphate mannosyltransferase
MKVVIILPTYNERENIASVLDQLATASRQVKKHAIQYLVVDDNSPDGTEDVVRKYQKNHKDVYIVSGKKEGLGKAILRGTLYAIGTLKAEIILQLDADLSHDPNVFPEFLEAIDNGADFAVGSRYIRGGSIPDNWGIHRKIYSVLGNSFVRFGLGHPEIHDWTGGYRAYKIAYIQKFQHELEKYNGYVFQIAFLHKSVKLGAQIREVPIHFTDRKYGHSKIAPSQYIRDIFSYVISERVKQLLAGSFLKFCVVGLIGFIINTAVLELMVKAGYFPAIGSVVGAELAIISNFILNNFWTFNTRKVQKNKLPGKFLQFNTTSLGAIIIQSGTVAAGSALFGITTYRLFYILGVGIGLVWNYIMYSKVIWKKTNSGKQITPV